MWILTANCQQEFLLYQNLQQEAFGPERWIHFDQKCFEWNGLLNNKVFLRLIQIFFQVSYEVDRKTFNTMSRILSFRWLAELHKVSRTKHLELLQRTRRVFGVKYNTR